MSDAESGATFLVIFGEKFKKDSLSKMIKSHKSFFLFVFLTIFIYANTGSNFAQSEKNTETSVSRQSKVTDKKSDKNKIKILRKAVKSDDEDKKINDKPKESKLTKAGTFNGDVRDLRYGKLNLRELPKLEIPGMGEMLEGDPVSENSGLLSGPSAVAPSPLANFIGLDFANWGSGRPPDAVGDVGPTYFVQAVNSSVGIYRKSDGVRVAAFTLNALMSQGAFGNLCDTDNINDPVVLYDSFEDRWIITDSAFTTDGSGNLTSNSYQCYAVSKTGDPVGGGWNFYSTVETDALADYSKLGVWNDGIYMSSNMFTKNDGTFLNVRVRALNKFQMYAGNPSVQTVSFDIGGGEFTVLPANARLQTGTPAAGTPNLMSVVWQYTNAISVYKFKANWNKISSSTLTGPSVSFAPTSWSSPPSTVPTTGTQNNDTLAVRLMMQNQYTNIGGVESLWNIHTVRGSAETISAIRYYQVNVTGGTVAAATSQAATYAPDTINRYISSLAVNRAGDMAFVFSASSSALIPAIRYAGRLSTDPVNTISQTETSLIEGGGTQENSTSWGEYSAMTLDPDGCTFWMTSEYYAVTGENWQTRIGSFAFPGCSPLVNNGILRGTVTSSITGQPLSGVTVMLGSRTTTTNAAGFYSFVNLPTGNYLSEAATAAGYSSNSASNIIISDGSTTTQNFALENASASACLVDTSQSDFQMGVPNNVDLTTNPGAVTLVKEAMIDQQNNVLSDNGVGITVTNWRGQTFTPAVSGTLTKADINLFCSNCSGKAPDLTLSVRATSGGIPVGADLATASINGFSSGASDYRTGTFANPLSVTAGTTYALIIRPTTNPSAGIYALTISATDVYANGQRIASTDSGATWSGSNTDAGFRTYIDTGYVAAGSLVSSTKDADSVVAASTMWKNLSWTATTPPNTSIKFQAAGSNNANEPFNFVGPDGTAATFFTVSGSSLSQFNGLRYLKYKAYLAATNNAVTPTLNDVTVCYTNSNYEADVASRPNGDGVIQSNDVVQMTRFLNELDAFNTSTNEFQRADSAPRSSNGDGSISSADVVQTIRYLNEIDSPQIVGGPIAPNSNRSPSTSKFAVSNPINQVESVPNVAPELRFESTSGSAGNQVAVNIKVDAVGNESQYSFAVLFDPSVLNFNSLAAGGTGSNNFTCNVTATAGRVRCSIGEFPNNQPGSDTTTIKEIDPGDNQLLIKVIFNVSADAQSNKTTPVNLGGVSAANDNADSIILATTNGMVTITAPTAASAAISGRVMAASGRGIGGASVSLTDAAGKTRTSVTTAFGYYRFTDVEAGATYIINAKAKRYRFDQTRRVLNLTGDTNEVNFTANGL